ncbi:hypothetical protein A2957_03055 [Candidatus Roizmanbacteria bacterium RIFCSPLOWO2_01_FULL_38_11]|uniref:Probable transcriptional regulatory protein A2957_03055 n=1 Tax=Candidatus Roizmanbacteria bacterium RIFCSPLOWO2_01_FULL_38_11 TaxID=1802060 RepID=A0A1F7INB3_9BACT|nr:MAG: hypothetical protein A2957_03055 [Candidatus Roizmanbacteria bacterium RIFCSPLOWO2_01_FULL_38_11]
MSGHSKWAQIKRQKASNDQQRSHEFSKMSRLITIAVHEGGGITDSDKNFKLRLTIERAKYINMPKDTIQRAIDKAAGGEGTQIKEIIYEGFGHGGVGLLIAATTDNSNRTHAEIKQVLEKNGGKIAGQNAVAHLFQRCGVVVFSRDQMNEQDALEFTEKIGAFDIEEDKEGYIIYFPFERLGKIREIAGDINPNEVDVFYKALVPMKMDNSDIEKNDRLIERLESLEDVHNIYTSAE